MSEERDAPVPADNAAEEDDLKLSPEEEATVAINRQIRDLMAERRGRITDIALLGRKGDGTDGLLKQIEDLDSWGLMRLFKAASACRREALLDAVIFSERMHYLLHIIFQRKNEDDSLFKEFGGLDGGDNEALLAQNAELREQLQDMTEDQRVLKLSNERLLRRLRGQRKAGSLKSDSEALDDLEIQSAERLLKQASRPADECEDPPVGGVPGLTQRGQPPYGFRRKDGRFYFDPAVRASLDLLVTLRDVGVSYRDIADRLNSAGHRTATGLLFTQSAAHKAFKTYSDLKKAVRRYGYSAVFTDPPVDPDSAEE